MSSQTLDKDGKAWARIEGIGNDESPFAFCGAVYPLHITWSLGGHGVVEIMSPLGVFLILFCFMKEWLYL